MTPPSSILVAVTLAASVCGGFGFEYITASEKKDGFGAQLQAKISCILEARSRAESTAYVHLPFTSVAHTNLGASVEELDQLVNLGYGELRPSDLPSDVNITEKFVCHGFADSHTALYELLKGDLFAKLQASPRSVPFQNMAGKCADEEVCVAVHIRRGDVHEASGERYLPNQHFAEIMGGIIQGLQRHNLTAKFNIHSQGSESDYQEVFFQDHHAVNLHLNQSMFEAWQSMAAADILVLSPSSFSYTAALYNQGLIVYNKFWHAPLPSWTTFLDREELAKAFAEPHVGVLLRRKIAARQ